MEIIRNLKVTKKQNIQKVTDTLAVVRLPFNLPKLTKRGIIKEKKKGKFMEKVKEVTNVMDFTKQEEETTDQLKNRIAKLEEELKACKEESEKKTNAINQLAVKCQEFEITVRTIYDMFNRQRR